MRTIIQKHRFLKQFQLYKLLRACISTKKQETPCHVPVMMKEVVEGLNIKQNDVIIDMTFGGGGHTKFIMENYGNCKVIALDRDETAFDIAQDLAAQYKDRIVPLLGRFSELDSLLTERGIESGSINSIMLDAGCSSIQFEDAQRGFSLVRDGPLDMRMGNRCPSQISAADVVNNLSENDLNDIILKYGDERCSRTIAQSIVQHRPIHTTLEFARAVSKAFKQDNVYRIDGLGRRSHIATKTFMAIRIFVNDEMNEIHHAVQTAEKYLTHGGKMAILTFHSLEDRLVKRLFQQIDLSKPFNMRLSEARSYKGKQTGTKKWNCHKSPLLPSGEEVESNTKSRSAKLRIATRNRNC